MTSDQGRRAEDLERQLLDERRERDAAQRRVAKLSERVDLWRSRAEERSVRIAKLEEERDRLRGPIGWLRRARRAGLAPMEPPASATPETTTVPTKIPPRFPSVRCVTIAEQPDLRVAARLFDSVDFDKSVSLMEADVVLADAAGLRELSGDAARTFEEWTALDVRPPLVLADDVAGDLLKHANAILSTEDLTGRFFEPAMANPGLRDALGGDAFTGVSIAEVESFGTVVTEPYDLTLTRHLELAATGVPFIDIGNESIGPDELRRRGVQHRRFAYERRSVQLDRFANKLTVDLAPMQPRVAGILVSNRPVFAARAIEQLADQRFPGFELIVGCHGFRSSEVSEAVNRLSDRVDVHVIEFDPDVSLGECLNRAVSTTNAEILAKMDDDDHYGPAYLVDAVQAIEYSQAEIVGKGASYTYVEAEDRTLLRRPGSEETFYNGSPTGATLVWSRYLWETNPFAHRTVGEDLAFLRGARRLGHRVYVNSPFEFVYHRRRSGNTWQASDALFVEGAQPAWDGDRPRLADVPDLGFSAP